MKVLKFITAGFMIVSVLLLTSCISIPHRITIDKTLPKSETAVVHFDAGIDVRTFNGIAVKNAWKGYFIWSNESVKVTIPAGETEVVYDYDGYSHSAKNLKLIYVFEAGDKYKLGFTKKEGRYGIFLKKNGKDIEFWELGF